MRILRRSFLLSISAFCIFLPRRVSSADGTDTTVEMRNFHPTDEKARMVFYPRIVVVQPGETVLFKATDRGHNSASIEGMIPDGAAAWDGAISEDIAVSFTVPGFYGHVCTPHESVGMVGLVVVEGPGKLDNLESARAVRHRGRAKRIWGEIWAQAEADGLLEHSG
ncbi:MAG: pseudoazurin [Pseudomonadota bacterium]